MRIHLVRLLRRALPRSFWGRSLLIVITPVILIQMVSSYVFFQRHWEDVTRFLAQGLVGDMMMGLVLLDTPQTDPQLQATERLIHRTTGLEVRHHKGALPPLPPTPLAFQSRLDRVLRNRLTQPYRLQMGEDISRVWIQGTRASFCFSFPTKRLFSRTTPLWVLWSCGASILFAFLASVFMRRQIRPLEQLATFAQGLETGQSVGGYRLRGAREIRQVGLTFLNLHRQVIAQLHERTQMLAGISHDLRTPLTRMKLQLALLPPSEEWDAFQKDVDQLIAMVEGYLAFISGESQREEAVPLNLATQILPLARHVVPPSLHLMMDIPSHLGVVAPPLAFDRCLRNVLENAIRYAQYTIQITAHIQNNHLYLTVEDDGPGVSPTDYDVMVQPFVRLDTSRNAQTGGSGLGLAIVNQLLGQMSGTLRVDASSLGGVRVTFIIPQKQ